MFLLRQPERSGQSRLRHVRTRSLRRLERAEEGQGDLRWARISQAGEMDQWGVF